MTTRMTLTKTLAALSATALLAVGLTACSSGDSTTEAFCKASDSLNSMDQIDPSDPAGAIDAIKKANDTVQKMDAPKEIADDIKVYKETMASMVDAFEGVDTSDAQAFGEAYMEAVSSVDTAKLTTADTNITAFETENCK